MRITIITVCLNAEKTIERTINSVITQCYPEIEYIIIDGGSEDGTVDVIKKHLGKIDYWLSEKDGGVFDAMNKGVSHATGEIIGFINANDWYEKDILYEVEEMFTKHKCDVVYGDLMLCDEAGAMEEQSNRDINLDNYNGYFPILQPTSFVRSDLLRIYPFDTSYRIAADAKWFWMQYKRGYSFEYINKRITYFTTGGLSSRTEYVSKEWKKAALEAASFEIEKRYQYWRFMDGLTENDFGVFFVDYLRSNLVAPICLVGAGKLLENLLPYLEKSKAEVRGFYDDRVKELEFHGELHKVRKKKELSSIRDAVVLISTIMHEREIRQEVEKYAGDLKLIRFSILFADAVESYLDRRII